MHLEILLSFCQLKYPIVQKILYFRTFNSVCYKQVWSMPEDICLLKLLGDQGDTGTSENSYFTSTNFRYLF